MQLNIVKISIVLLLAGGLGVAMYMDDKSGQTAAPATVAATQPMAAPVAEPELSVLLRNCASGGRVSCDDDLYRKVWLRLESDTGEFTKVNTNFRKSSNNGSVVAIVYTYTMADTNFDPRRLRRLLFDCSGHYIDVTDQISAEMDATPRLVAGRIAALACGR